MAASPIPSRPEASPGLDDSQMYTTSGGSTGEAPAEAIARVALLFFGPCPEAVLWFANFGGLRTAKGLAQLRGRSDERGELAAIVRRLGSDPVGLAFAGWTSLDYWRGQEAALR